MLGSGQKTFQNSHRNRHDLLRTLSLACIISLLVMGLFIGLSPASPDSVSGDAVNGWHPTTISWPFVLIYALTVLDLCAVVVRRALRFSWKDYSFYLNHVGLLFLLLFAGLGSLHKQAGIVSVPIGGVENEFTDSRGNIIRLPFDVRPVEGNAHTNQSVVRIEPVESPSFSRRLEVNKPIRFGSWMIYQYGCVTFSDNSTLVCRYKIVGDKWLTETYVGILMTFLGAVGLLWQGQIKRRRTRA